MSPFQSDVLSQGENKIKSAQLAVAPAEPFKILSPVLTVTLFHFILESLGGREILCSAQKPGPHQENLILNKCA